MNKVAGFHSNGVVESFMIKNARSVEFEETELTFGTCDFCSHTIDVPVAELEVALTSQGGRFIKMSTVMDYDWGYYDFLTLPNLVQFNAWLSGRSFVVEYGIENEKDLFHAFCGILDLDEFQALLSADEDDAREAWERVNAMPKLIDLTDEQ